MHSSEIRPFITKEKAINLLVSFQKVGNQSDILSSTQVYLHSTINEQMLPAMRTSLQNLKLWTSLWSRLSSLNTDREAPAELDAAILLVWFLQWWLGCFLRDCLNVFLLFLVMRLSFFPGRLEVICHDTDPFCSWRSCESV